MHHDGNRHTVHQTGLERRAILSFMSLDIRQ